MPYLNKTETAGSLDGGPMFVGSRKDICPVVRDVGPRLGPALVRSKEMAQAHQHLVALSASGTVAS